LLAINGNPGRELTVEDLQEAYARATPQQEPECVRAPEKDSLSEAKARAEELLRKLA